MTNHGYFDNVKDPQIQPHAGIKTVQVLVSLIYICDAIAFFWDSKTKTNVILLLFVCLFVFSQHHSLHLWYTFGHKCYWIHSIHIMGVTLRKITTKTYLMFQFYCYIEKYFSDLQEYIFTIVVHAWYTGILFIECVFMIVVHM